MGPLLHQGPKNIRRYVKLLLPIQLLELGVDVVGDYRCPVKVSSLGGHVEEEIVHPFRKLLGGGLPKGPG